MFRLLQTALCYHSHHVSDSQISLQACPQLQQPVSHLIPDCLSVSQAVVDDSKARKELGYKAHLSREEGLAQLRAEAAEKHAQSEN